MADVQRLTELQLVPVIDLLPSQFSDREPPETTDQNHRASWNRHWVDCLEEAGVTGLAPVAPDSFLVPVAALAELATLERVVGKLAGSDDRADPDAASALSGGFALVSGGAVLIEPNCCSDLKDWGEWRGAAALTGPEWRMVWIGHPWLSARADGPDLILAGPHESEAPEPRWVLDRRLIPPAVDRAVRELEQFADRLTVVLLGADARTGPTARALARRLAGLSISEDGSEAPG